MDGTWDQTTSRQRRVGPRVCPDRGPKHASTVDIPDLIMPAAEEEVDRRTCCRFPCSSALHEQLCRLPVVFVVQLGGVYELLVCPPPLPVFQIHVPAEYPTPADCAFPDRQLTQWPVAQRTSRFIEGCLTSQCVPALFG